MGLERRARSASDSGLSITPPAGSVLSARFPLVWEFLTRTVWEDGSSRASGSLTFFLDGPALKVCLSDKDSSQRCFVSGPTLEACLEQAEQALGPGKGDWRAERPVGARGRR
jgi:hypothetical protein